MLWEGLKLMAVGMTTVMFFLMLMIVCIECLKIATRDFNLLEQETLKEINDRARRSTKVTSTSSVPIEVLAAAIAAYEADQNTI